ncbi:MAG: 30S ribosomal protein S18 [Anaerolineales bacterium]|nr:30S ribosomal protein S18 [Anaerolineae bacterium]PWB75714.1 MAG: 30S ribosomal protein S18 [Anaerolineales bacterium]
MSEDRRSSDGQGGERRFFAKPKFCQFCADKTLTIDYKKTDLLRKFVTEEGKIRPRRQTGNCAKHQRAVAAAVKQARQIALLPFTGAQADEMR